jgi:hypothetical protein
MTRLAVAAAVAAVLASRPAAGAERAIPFWPDEVPAAIAARVDGNVALQTVRDLSRFHRVQGSAPFKAAAEMIRQRAQSAGLTEASILSFPADGTTAYGHFRSYYGWEWESARVEELSPRAGVIASFPELPVALADYSQDADVEAELVDVGSGSSPRDYEGKDVRGKIVLSHGPLPRVHGLACVERGAVGFLSAFPNQTTAWSGEDRDYVRWGHLDPYEKANRFAFMVSARQADELRGRLAAGERIVLRARVNARMVPAGFDVVTAAISGTDPASGEVLLTAHLCHESAGANDNASGSAAILETARTLQSAIAAGALPRPRRTIRFLWVPEIAGTQAYLVRNPEIARRAVAAINMDMVGGSLTATRGSFHLSRTAETLPHAANAIARAWLEDVRVRSARHAERGGDPREAIAARGGSREAFVGDLRATEPGSDHDVLQAFGVPTVYFHDWPDVTIHTDKDRPENLDATKLGRVAYMGAGIAWTLAALPDAEVGRLIDAVRADAEERLARVRLRTEEADLALGEAAAMGAASLQSVGRQWPVAAARAKSEALRLASMAPPVPTRASPVAPTGWQDTRVPTRAPHFAGPVSVYYFDPLGEGEGPGVSRERGLAARAGGEVLEMEAVNLIDGKRTVAQIRDVLSGRYIPVPVSEVGAYFDALARVGLIVWK